MIGKLMHLVWMFLLKQASRIRPSYRNLLFAEPGHFYSPLVDLEQLEGASSVEFDGSVLWETVGINSAELTESHRKLLSLVPDPDFANVRLEGRRYFYENDFFGWADAFTLTAMMRRFAPKRIVEIGSGFSSAVMLDEADQSSRPLEMTFIEPNPERLASIIGRATVDKSRVIVSKVQEVDLSVFLELEPNDICFIDSSHVAKVGSDVTWLFLNVVPRLRPGVIIHVHDITYPDSYPVSWVRQGRSWNESILLRAFLIGQESIEILAFNAWASTNCAEVFPEEIRRKFCEGGGASFWFRKTELPK